MREKNIIPILYKKLLTLYPRRFRERLGESMEQTFLDLYAERQQQPGRSYFLLATFTETAFGIVQEHIYLLMEGHAMKKILANPRSAAMISLILSLPFGLLLLILFSGVTPVAEAVESVLTVDGTLNPLGRIVLLGGMVLLPVAFLLNLQPVLTRDGPEGRRKLYSINLIVGAFVLVLITVTWGSLLWEQIYCLQGIRCD